MYTLKGFVSVNGLANPSPSSVAPIGEISDLALTYSLGQYEYPSPTNKYILRAFSSSTVVGVTSVPADLLTQAFAIIDWAITMQQSQTPATSPTDFTTAMVTQFGTQANAIGCGNLINSGTFLFPEYITWVNPNLLTNDPTVGGKVTLWFADASFRAQYDEYIIKVVPPLPNLDTFLTGATSVAAALSAYGVQPFLSAMQTTRGSNPETLQLIQTYDYVDPLNSANQISTNWGIVIYGSAGNNVDAIREAVQHYIAVTSTAPESQWRAIFPEIYIATEFLLFPRWMNYGIPQMILQAGAYSEVITLNKELNYLTSVLTDYDPAFILSTACALPTMYKSLVLLAVPNEDNAVADQQLLNIFPDLINVPTSDTSYNLMSSKTRSWLSILTSMLIVAESATVQSALPAGMSLAVRDTVLFVAQEYAGITYLVATKASTPGY